MRIAEQYLSTNAETRLIIPISPNDIHARIEQEDRVWKNRPFDANSLIDFSDACKGYCFHLLEGRDNIFLTIVKTEERPEVPLTILLEENAFENLPCAFFDEITNEYTDFSITSDATVISVTVNEAGCVEVSGLIDDEASVSAYVPEDDAEEFLAEEEEQSEEIPSEGEPAEGEPAQESEERDCDELLRTWKDCFTEIERKLSTLHSENKLLREENLALKAATMGTADDAIRAENDRLRILISQLADREFGGEYIAIADAEIGDRMKQVAEKRALIEEKKASLSVLETEYASLTDALNALMQKITDIMAQIHAAETLQQQRLNEIEVARNRLTEMLTALNTSISILKLHGSADEIDALFLETEALKAKLETKLALLNS